MADKDNASPFNWKNLDSNAKAFWIVVAIGILAVIGAATGGSGIGSGGTTGTTPGSTPGYAECWAKAGGDPETVWVTDANDAQVYEVAGYDNVLPGLCGH